MVEAITILKETKSILKLRAIKRQAILKSKQLEQHVIRLNIDII